MHIIGILLFLAFLIPSVDAAECRRPWLTWEKQLRMRYPDLHIDYLDATETERMVRAYNESPPASDAHPDQVMVVKSKVYETYLVVFVSTGCASVYFKVTEDQMESVLPGRFGRS
jgi:hypothetical protein